MDGLRMDLTQEDLKESMHYCPESGAFARRIGALIIPVNGSTDSYGYKQVRVNGKKYLAHRLAWLYMHGGWPPDQVDHCNGMRSDNRLKNLRLATNAQNRQNIRSAYSNSKSGALGVTWDKKTQKWQAKISLNGAKNILGFFENIADASAAYIAAKREIHFYGTI